MGEGGVKEVTTVQPVSCPLLLQVQVQPPTQAQAEPG